MPSGQIVGRAKRVKIKLRLKLSSAGVSHHHVRGTYHSPQLHPVFVFFSEIKNINNGCYWLQPSLVLSRQSEAIADKFAICRYIMRAGNEGDDVCMSIVW